MAPTVRGDSLHKLNKTALPTRFKNIWLLIDICFLCAIQDTRPKGHSKMSSRMGTYKQQAKWVGIFCAALAIIEVINLLTGRALNQFGLVPRHISSLPGIFIGPFLHANLWHFFANIIPLAIFIFLMFQHGVKKLAWLTLWVIVCTGICVWLFGRPAVHIGASGVIYGYFGYLVLGGILSKRLKLVVIALLVGFFYGSMMFGLFPTPTRPYVSWESHFFGFVAGLSAAWFNAKRKLV